MNVYTSHKYNVVEKYDEYEEDLDDADLTETIEYKPIIRPSHGSYSITEKDSVHESYLRLLRSAARKVADARLVHKNAREYYQEGRMTGKRRVYRKKKKQPSKIIKDDGKSIRPSKTIIIPSPFYLPA